MALVRKSLATRRSSSVENKRDGMAYNTYGWTPVASIRQTTLSSSMLSTPCSVGTVTQLDATSIYQMFQALPYIPKWSLFRSHGIRTFGKVDGSLEDGRSKSFLPLAQSSFSVVKACGSVIKTH
jgi:hypothetical protein